MLAEVRREVPDLFDVRGDAVTLLLRRGEAFVRFEPGPVAAGSGDEPEAVELDDLRRRAVAGLGSGHREGRRRLAAGRPLRLRRRRRGPARRPRAAGFEIGDDEVELLQILASQAAAALANAALYRTLERQAITDGLTGLYNHRYFYERLNQEIAQGAALRASAARCS